MKRVVIAGGGIIGASIAWHLSRRTSVEVTLVEKSHPAAGTTKDSFAWINANYLKQPQAYFALNCEGIAAWRRLELAMASPPEIQWGGSVHWFGPGIEADELGVGVERQQQWGYSTRLVDASSLRELLPGVEPGTVERASFSDVEGVVDPVAVTLSLLKEAAVTLVHPCEVTGLELADGRVRQVITSRGKWPSDVFVVACGVGTPALAAMAGVRVPLKESPGVLAHTAVQPRLLQRAALGPRSHIKQDSSGRIVAGNFAGVDGTDGSREQGEALLRSASGYLPGMDLTLERVSVGWRVMPTDEYPIVGFADECPNLYVVATHSGVTLAPLLGEYAAAEIVDGASVAMLEPYRLSRFSADA